MGYIYEITMMSGEAGLNFEARQLEEEYAEYLCTQAANTFAVTKLYLDSLLVYGGEIPDWGSERPTWEEAMADEKFGDYVPTDVPDGFAFEDAWREWGQDPGLHTRSRVTPASPLISGTPTPGETSPSPTRRTGRGTT